MTKKPDRVSEADHEGKQLQLPLHSDAVLGTVKGSKGPNLITRVVALEDLVLALCAVCDWATMPATDRARIGHLASQVKRATFDTGWFTTSKEG